MDKVREIEQNLSKIITLIEKEEPVYASSEFFRDTIGGRWKFQGKIDFFRDFSNTFFLLKNFFAPDTISLIDEKLKPLLKLFDDFSDSNNNISDDGSSVDEFYKAIDDLPNLKKLPIVLPPIINRDDFINLINFIRSQYQLFLGYSNEELLDQTDLLDSQYIQSKFIELYNYLINSMDAEGNSDAGPYKSFFDTLIHTSRMKENLGALEETYQNTNQEVAALEKKRQDTASEIENLSQKAVEVKRDIGNQSNLKLQQVFDTEAKSLNLKIDKLHDAIFAFFGLLLLVIFTAVVMVYNNENLKIERFYIFYLSTFLTVTAILTYLIKERSRIVKYQHYCQISYLEISALSDYTAQLNDKEKSEDLKIQLAYKYFQGPNGHLTQKTDEQDFNVVSSKLNELTNIVKDIKSVVGK